MRYRRSPLRGLAIAWKAFCYTLGALVIAFVLAQAWFFAHVVYYNSFAPGSTAFMDRALDELSEKNPRARLAHRWVPYERISVNLRRAVVAAEDARFLDHEGFDWEMIQKAIAKNERRGRVVAGASTISQQLVKNELLTQRRSLDRKIQEALLTWRLEARLSKKQILERYLNIIELGPRIHGVAGAARYWFDSSAYDLEIRQAAFLAALDQTVVATSMRVIADDLHGFSLQAWATTAFLITSTIATPLYGKLSIPPQGDATFPNGFPRHGDSFNVDSSDFTYSTYVDEAPRFNYGHGPTQRFVIDMDPAGPKAYNALPGGAIWDNESPHFADEAELWRKNETHAVPFLVDDVIAAKESRTVVSPAAAP